MPHAIMNNTVSSNLREPTVRITRARAKALGKSIGLPPLHPSKKQDDKPVRQTTLKRAANDHNKPDTSSAACSKHKRRAVLKDVTNITHENLYINTINAAKEQVGRQDRKGSMQNQGKVKNPCSAKSFMVSIDRTGNATDETAKLKGEESNAINSANLTDEVGRQDRKDSVQKQGKMEPPCNANNFMVSVDRTGNTTDETTKLKMQESNAISSANLTDEVMEFVPATMLSAACQVPMRINSNENIPLISSFNGYEGKLCITSDNLDDRGIIDIDSNHKDPQMCSLYAADIYSNLYTRQIDRRPSVDYMESLQRDINQGMRAILIDWLVEVSEEYRLVPDTLYLTVNLIDRFLSENYVEKQKLQLLGVTCMLIASKYEEICAPRVEEFCFITDNTYTKEEVVRMESRALNFLGFQLSVPTTKKFLRRFIQATQVSYEVPSVKLEFLANYLAELTLMDYSFLKFLPSLIAASAVFLARWMLDQSDHPWNPTLEHYTTHSTSDLKVVLLKLQDLHLNSSGCMLNAIRNKYKQSKFKCVSTLSSVKPIQSLFDT